ncbi:MAG: hypothetical protein M3256_20480, partial [Actinomycetota bacterium]|nr:hypothetical protein [Actinomycetota bacterium]
PTELHAAGQIDEDGGDRISESLVVEAARESLDSTRSKSGASDLAALALRDGIESACAVAATLLASVALSEHDRHDEAISLLQQVLVRVTEAASPDSRLLRSVLLQQLALRRSEIGQEGVDEAKQVLELLEGLRTSDLSSFYVSKGVRWRSSHTLATILEELRWVADIHIANSEQDLLSRDWVRFVRAPAPRLGLQIRAHAASGLEHYIADRFSAHTDSQPHMLFMAEDPVETPVYAALLHYELLGASRYVREWRSTLAKIRILRQDPASDHVWSRQDALRLLRQADDSKALDAVLRFTRAGGPLLALSGDALQIIASRLKPSRLSRVDLAVLSAAAHLLTSEQALSALTAVLDYIAAGAPSPKGRWEAASLRLESAWRAAVELSGPADQLDRVATELLHAARLAPRKDQLLVSALSRAARDIEWESVSASTREEWGYWLTSNSSAVGEAMTDTVGPQIGVDIEPGTGGGSPLARAASMLNRFFRNGVLPSKKELHGLEGEVTAQLRRVRDDAALGAYSGGGLSVGDIAAGLALHFDMSDLWLPLADFLLDMRVSREDKAAPLDRLAQPTASVPEEVISTVALALDELLAAVAPGPFDSGITPFPAALRFAVSHSLLTDERLLGYLSKLCGSGDGGTRVEAARTLAFTANASDGIDWIVVMGLLLTHDSDPLVRAESGRCLAGPLRRNNQYRALLDQRLLDMLSEDGLLVPLLVLRGLRSSGAQSRLTESLRVRISQLAATHPARGIRLQARAVLGV